MADCRRPRDHHRVALTIDHYYAANYPTSIFQGSFCDINTFFNCDSSAYSWIADIGGVPLGFFGLLLGALVMLGAVFPSSPFERTTETLSLINTIKSRLRLLDNGSLLAIALGRGVVEYDWDGNLVWAIRAGSRVRPPRRHPSGKWQHGDPRASSQGTIRRHPGSRSDRPRRLGMAFR